MYAASDGTENSAKKVGSIQISCRNWLYLSNRSFAERVPILWNALHSVFIQATYDRSENSAKKSEGPVPRIFAEIFNK
jgi:hypothetical protein